MDAERRYAVVGTGSRAALYVGALATTHADAGTIVAWCDPNPARMDLHDATLAAAGRALPARYPPDRFAELLTEQRPDVVVVTSPDATHHTYVVAALEAGVDVVVEKPLTTRVNTARRIAEAAAASPGTLTMTFNYRYAARNAELRRLVASGELGTITSVHFEWVLDTVHGADYFRRWHRDKAMSGGLLVHKSTHHFDLVNWWLDDVPEVVTAAGGLRFYGDAAAAERGLGPRPERSTGSAGAADDPFALDLRSGDWLRRAYLEAERHDGYLRDRDVFSTGISIEDDLGVLVRYGRGAFLTYSLTAHGPWEGYRVSINGTRGRAELDVVERGYVWPGLAEQVLSPGTDWAASAPVAEDAHPRPRRQRLLLQRHWEVAEEVPLPVEDGGHGGADRLLLDDVFRPGSAPDPLGRRAGYRDGLRSISVGLAANEALATGGAVRIAEFGLPLRP